jgi:molybdopterin converting factor small subunit
MANAAPPPGHFNLLYFAAAASYTHRESETFRAPLALARLFPMLDEKYPGMQDKVLSSCAVTVNLDYVDVEKPFDATKCPVINEGDEVAIIPPVSSG